MPDTDVTYWKRRDRVKPVTKREFEAFDGLADTLAAQGWEKVTAGEAKKQGLIEGTSTITKEA
jgi:hypothetical protein